MSRLFYIKDVCRSKLQGTSDIHNTRAMLYRQSSLIFQKLHQKESPISVNKAAAEYSDALREQIKLVEQYYSELALSKERQVYLQLSAIWQLCQIVYFSDCKDDIKSLMEWHNQINTSLFYEYDKQAIYFNLEGTFEHPDFWPYVIRMATLANTEQISSILKHVLLDVSVSEYNNLLPYIMALCDITSSFLPDAERLKSIITNLNATGWMHPKTKYHADQICTVMSIFLGNETVTIRNTQDDIHAYICCRYYRSSVGSFNDFSARNPPKTMPHSSQKILRHIIAGDIYQAMEECIHYDWWLLAHLSDLLTMNQMIDREIKIPVETDTLSMPNQFGLWKQAFSYMLECGDLGKEAVVEHLNTMDLNVEDTVVMDVVEFCINQSLESTGIEIYKKKATMCMESNDYTRALLYYKKAKQDQSVDDVFYEMIWQLAKTGKWFDLSALGTAKYDGVYYTIYRHLSNFYGYMTRSELEDATNEFRALINSDSVPYQMMPIVIWEGLGLIKDSDKALLTRSDILVTKLKWQALNKHASTQDFKLFYYYYQQDKSAIPQQNEKLDSILKFQKQDFLDTTGVCFSRALEKCVE
ncbi:hypothetical protein [Parasitella parasitica]|uniref:Nuclear pore complex protein Nup85 n=1 Tax=Parasitella parasitica TaxID=35722 RepID=A0A0B7MR36_9FUNG|nr:hypothetical protein [Parasitella parasitica]